LENASRVLSGIVFKEINSALKQQIAEQMANEAVVASTLYCAQLFLKIFGAAISMNIQRHS
jgi:hypothetical protein